MMKVREYAELDATGLAALVRSKQVSPKEVLQAAMEAMEQVNPKLNAVVDYTYEYALEQIKAGIDYTAPFCGVPLAIKDCGGFAKGIRATLGSRLAGKGVYADCDSTLFKRMKKAGVIAVATAATSEFCIDSSTETLRHGPTRNPWNPEYSPGGSSGGSAALVAAGGVPIAHGSDGGGSIRIPASMCGIVGFKPSRFRIPTGPNGWDPGGSVSFILSRTVRDSAAMLDAVEGWESGYYGMAAPRHLPYAQAAAADSPKLRIAYMLHTPYGSSYYDEECEKAVLEAAEALRGLGHCCEEAYPEIRETYHEARVACMNDEIALEIEELAEKTGLPIDESTLEPLVYKTYVRSKNRMGLEVFKAKAELALAGRRMGHFFETYDVLIGSAVGRISRRLGTLNGVANGEMSVAEWERRRRDYACNAPLANVTGLPSISVPMYMSREGMPLGIQIDGRIDDDQTVLMLAAQLERAGFFIQQQPPIYAGESKESLIKRMENKK